MTQVTTAPAVTERQQTVTFSQGRQEKTHTFTVTPEHEAAYEAKWRGISEISSLITQLEKQMVNVYVASKKLPQLPDGIEAEDFVLQTFGLLSNILWSLHIENLNGKEIGYLEDDCYSNKLSNQFVEELISISMLAEAYTRKMYVDPQEDWIDEDFYRPIFGDPAHGWGIRFEC